MKRLMNTISKKVAGFSLKGAEADSEVQEDWQGWDAWVNIENTIK